MPDFLRASTTFFTVFGYSMSYVEFFGTALNIASVWLVARNNILTWPVGIVAVILFAILFYDVRLYSDFVEQIYFLITGFYGWWIWIKLRSRRGPLEASNDRAIVYLSPAGRLATMAVVTVGTAVMGYVASNLHSCLPALFPAPAAFPYLDAFTTVMSFTAQILMAHKRIESWVLWISVDVIGIGLYFARGVKLVSLLYVIFLVLAIRGLYRWRRDQRRSAERPAPIDGVAVTSVSSEAQ